MRARGMRLVIAKEGQAIMRRRKTRLVNLVAHVAKNRTVQIKNKIHLVLLSFRPAVQPYI